MRFVFFDFCCVNESYLQQLKRNRSLSVFPAEAFFKEEGEVRGVSGTGVTFGAGLPATGLR